MITLVKAIPWILSVAAVGLCALLFFQLRSADRRLGELEEIADVITKANHDIKAATRSRADTERTVRSLAPADKLERLR